jgi:alpha-amylase
MWLAERVWEPGLPPLLAAAGIRYTLIDDGHFRYAGEGGPLQGYYVTEKAGVPIAIFPIDQSLRYAIPFQEPAQAMHTVLALKEQHGGRDVVVTYGDDGEKFGMWPGTKEWVWDKGWLREFFRLLDEAIGRGELRTGLFGEVLRATPPSGRVYLPTASYAEMGEWALPAAAQERYLDVEQALAERGELERARPFLRGGIWQGFLAKYPEANFMHKKMVQVSDKVAAAAARQPARSDDNERMRRELYRAQCNCSYWHGLFGGLYLNYLRDAVYRHLLVAEAFADGVLGNPAPPWAGGFEHARMIVEERDVDGDLEPEIVMQDAALDVVVRPHEGGALQELAYRPKTFMLSNVLSRHPEGYHRKLREHAAHPEGEGGAGPKSIHDVIKVKEPGLEQHLVYDRFNRMSLVDHFLPKDIRFEELARGERELGDFVAGRYARAAAEGAETVALVREGLVGGRRVSLRKAFQLDGARLAVRYQLALADEHAEPLEVVFAPDLALTLLDGHSQERVYRVADRDLAPEERELASRGSFGETPALALVNEANRFRIDLTFLGGRPTVWRYPLETVSMSEDGFERTYQGSVVVPLFPVRLERDPARIAVEVALSDL